MAVEHIPAEGAQHHLGQRVFDERIEQRTGLFDEGGCLLGPGVDTANRFALRDDGVDRLQVLWLGGVGLPEPGAIVQLELGHRLGDGQGDLAERKTVA